MIFIFLVDSDDINQKAVICDMKTFTQTNKFHEIVNSFVIIYICV